MHPSITLYDKEVLQFIREDFEIEILASDCTFTEGPVWNPQGFYLFSDIPQNAIYEIRPGSKKQIYLPQTGTEDPENKDLKPDQIGSNALAYDADGNLLICQHGNHAIAKWNGSLLQPFVHSYNNKPFNSPNDLILHSDGRIWFSDPPYGLRDGQLNPSKFQPLAGVYCWQGGNLQLICDKYRYPNGVCLSPDESLLYICSNKPFEKFISVYETSTQQFREILAEENSDGIETDSAGNIFLCNKDGLIILSPAGHRMALISLKSVPSNLCWGGNRKNDLFVTARENVFLIRGLGK